MKLTLIVIFATCAISMQSVMAEFEAKNLKCYRPLLSDLSGASLAKLLHSIDAPLPQNSKIDIDKRIERREFLKILEEKAKGRVTTDGTIVGLTVFKSALADRKFDAKLNTASIIEAIEYFCAGTDNVWQIERSEDGVYLIIKGEKDTVEQTAPRDDA